MFGIDTGLIEYVKLEKMRYMPEKIIGEMKQFCIPAAFDGVKNPCGKKKVWDYLAVDRAITLLTKKSGEEEKGKYNPIRVDFRSRKYHPVFVSETW